MLINMILEIVSFLFDFYIVLWYNKKEMRLFLLNMAIKMQDKVIFVKK